MFLWAGVWDALAVVFVAPILVFIVAVVVALQIVGGHCHDSRYGFFSIVIWLGYAGRRKRSSYAIGTA
jgi:hypothetical protein